MADDNGKPVTWFNWNNNEPNNYGTGEHWVEMELNGGSRTSKWNDWYFAADVSERFNWQNENKVICTFILPENCQEADTEGSGSTIDIDI